MTGHVRMGLVAGVAVALGSLSLAPVFVNWDWAPPVLLIIMVVTAIGIAARRFRPLTALAPLLQLAGGLMTVTVLYAPTHAFGSVLPTKTSLADLRSMLGDGGYAIRTQVAPAQTLPELLLVATISVGLVAVAVDALAVGLRQPAVAGLGLLVLYAVPTSSLAEGIPFWPFVAGVLGFLLLLFVDGRESLLRWGRGVSEDGSSPSLGLLSSQRIAVLAVVAAVAIPVLVPAFPPGILNSAGNGVGPGAGTSLNPLATLKGDLVLPQPRDLLRVRTNVADPYYLRAVSLETFTDQGWAPGNLDDQFVATQEVPAGLPDSSRTREVTADVTVLDQDDRYLPTYYSLRQVDVRGDWRYDAGSATVFSNSDRTGGLTYTFTAEEPQPTVARLTAARDLDSQDQIQRRFTELPGLVRPEISNLVGRLGADNGGPYQRTLSIFNYLTDRSNGFVYNLSTKPGTSGNDLVDFLANKQGYCEQYAAAMAVLLRFANVPARVVIGYTPGKYNAGSWTISTGDAHAWVEAYFQDIGWVPFDPTPLGAGRGVTVPYAPRADSTPAGASATASASAGTATGNLPTRQRETQAAGTAGSPTQTGRGGVLDPRTALISVALLLGFLLLIAPGGIRLLTRRRRLHLARGGGAVAAYAAWDEITATEADLGSLPARAETPRGAARRLARDNSFTGDTAEAIRLLAVAEERARYAPQHAQEVEGDLAHSATLVCAEMRRAAGRRDRVRARVLPASTLAQWRAGARARRRPTRRPAVAS